MTEFNPQKTPIADFPFPADTAVIGSMGSLYTVVDRDGYAFLACCPWCEEHGIASGFYAQQENGRLLVRDLTAVDEEWQKACRACLTDDYDTVPCAMPAGHEGDCAPKS